MCLRCWLLL